MQITRSLGEIVQPIPKMKTFLHQQGRNQSKVMNIDENCALKEYASTLATKPL